jgi:hypothetical protein
MQPIFSTQFVPEIPQMCQSFRRLTELLVFLELFNRSYIYFLSRVQVFAQPNSPDAQISLTAKRSN